LNFALSWFVLSLLGLQALGTPSPPSLSVRPPRFNNVLPFQLEGGFLIVVEGRIGPLDGLKFILDTGASLTMLDRKVADRLRLPLHPGTVLNFDRYTRIERAEAPELQLGPITVRNLPVMVGDLSQYSEFAKGIDAIVGLDVLGMSQCLQIDYATRRVLFKTARHEGSIKPRKPQTIIVGLPVQGQTVHLVIDTGLQGMLLYEDRLREHLPELKFTGKAKEERVGRLIGQRTTLSGVCLGPAESQATVLLIHGSPDALPADVDGYLGTASMNASVVELDFQTNTLRWQ
jgi:predicted aspartyl protease